jgi:hypothetical protein
MRLLAREAGVRTKEKCIVKLCSKVIFLMALLTSTVIQAGGIVRFSPDENKNGVRDDLDEYIQESYGDNDRLKLFLTDYTRLFQNIVVSHENKDKLIKQFDRLALMSRCFTKYDPNKSRLITRELKAKILNTIDLLIAYSKSNEKMDGRVITWSPLNIEKCSQYFELSE